jgi:transcriptional regulator with XRE-family HTH domain
MTIDQVLSDFIDAWNAGRRPRVDDFLERVPEAERDELADAVLAWLEVAPPPAYDAAALEAVRAEPALVALRAAAGPLPALVPQLRARRGLSVRQVAERVAERAGLRGQEERAADYLERLERGELDARRLSRRLLDALADALRTSGSALADAAAAAAPPRPAMGLQWRREQGGERFAAQLDALSAAALTPAPEEPLDELDRLFLGGPDA